MAGSARHMTGGKKSKKKKKRKAKGLTDSLVSNLTSGKGLMTAIALGVGAYEILKSNKNTGVPGGSSPPVPPAPVTGGQAVPPPLPGSSSAASSQQAAPVSEPATGTNDSRQLAVRLIEVMIAAAWADGNLDPEEESRILRRFQEQQLDREEKEFLLKALHEPKSIAQLSEGVQDPRVAQTMYTLAAATLVIDTDAERNWLDQLARQLSISPDMQSFIEEEV